MLPGNLAVMKAQVPLSRIAVYPFRPSPMSGGKVSYSMEFSHCERVPSNDVRQTIAQYRPKKAEEEQTPGGRGHRFRPPLPPAPSRPRPHVNSF